MRHITEGVYGLVMSRGIANGLAGRPRLRGIGAGLPKGGRTDPLTDAAEGEPRIRSEWEKAGAETPASKHGLGEGRFGSNRSPFLEVHTNPNMSDMPMRKATGRKTSAAFLMSIK